MKTLRLAALVITGLAVLGVSLHAASPHAELGCWLCALCPF